MLSEERIQGVIFDMDGLMFDTERLGLEGWKLAGRLMGYPIDDEMVGGIRGCNRADASRRFKERYGESFDYEAGRKIRTDYAEEEIGKRGVPVKPGLYTLLNFLKEKGIKMAVASGTERKKVLSYLESAKVLEYFDTVVCGDEVEHAKPWPDIFVRAAAHLGLECGICMVFEDSPNGLEAAFRAGCIPVMVPDLTPPDPEIEEKCYCVLESLEDAVELEVWG